MRIVVLDGYALNPGDLSWDRLRRLGECAIYDRTPAEETPSRSEGAEILLTNKTVLSGEVLDRLPECRYIGVLATGYNVVDTAAASGKGIVVTNVPVYGTRSVAQMTFAHILNLAQHVGEHGRSVKEGRWCESPDFCYWDHPQVELDGKTMGIIGLGRIGKEVARLARAFGMAVIGYDKDAAITSGAGRAAPTGAAAGDDLWRPVDVDEVFRRSDVVSLHCPLTPETERIVSAERLKLMKPTAYLINTGRGPLVDERALADALGRGEIAGAGLDVLSVEPPTPDNPLLSAPNCYVTPHIAWATRAARKRLLDAAVDNVEAYLTGRPVNVVGPVRAS